MGRRFGCVLAVIFDQAEFDLRCEWGLSGGRQLARISDVVIIVDVLSFSTAVDIAVANGAIVYPFREHGRAAGEFARSLNAYVAERVRGFGFSLSPASLREIPRGFRLVLPSPNGAALSLETGTKPTFTACLRNASAVASAASAVGKTFAVIPAGERWPDGSLRPCMEDLIGTGAVLTHLEGSASPEARLAIRAFESCKQDLSRMLRECASGKELVERGFAEDVALASELDVSRCAPVLADSTFVDAYLSGTVHFSPH